MSQDTQEQPAGPPTVVLVQQPPVVANDRRRRIGKPYMRRGAKLPNGWTVEGHLAVGLTAVGVLFLVISLTMFTAYRMIAGGFLVLLVGVLVLSYGISFWCAAKQQYEDLPPDHPDRLLYGGTPPPASHSETVATSYAFPDRSSQGIGWVGSTGPTSSYPPSAPPAYSLTAPPPSTQCPIYDPPPPYSEVVKDPQYMHT